MRQFILVAALAASIVSVTTEGGQQPAQVQPGNTGTGEQRKPGEAVQFQVPPMPELPNGGLGETDQPLIPGQRWRIRDLSRPKPAVVTPAPYPGQPPSDAIVLFDGKDLSQWTVAAFGGRGGARGAGATPPPAGSGGAATQSPMVPAWKVENGYMEVVPGAGSLTSKERFKDLQLHLEFASPAVPLGRSQYRGNSGITIGGREIQVLDNYRNDTYADGFVGAVYNQWPPLANPSRPPGEWQALDIAYLAPRYEGERLVRNAFITIFLNGVMIHNNREIFPGGRGGGRGAAPASGTASATPQPGGGPARGQTSAAPPGGELPIGLMGHPSAIPGNAVRYRNIWVRRVEVELPIQPGQPGIP